MKSAGLFAGLGLALCALPLHAADLGIATIVDNGTRLLRGVTWYNLVPGAHLQDGDIVEVADKAQVQAELATVGRLDLAGPATLYLLALPANIKTAPAPAMDLARGWLKIAAKSGPGARLRTSTATFNIVEAIAVVHTEEGLTEAFVEAGAVRLAEVDGAGKETTARDLQSGEYWSRSMTRPASTDRRAPPTFVAAMPRSFRDALPNLAGKFQGKTVTLVSERVVNYSEARPWLTGPYRKEFHKRFQPRLSDAAFRASVETHMAEHMEWDRLLHPEKYLPKDPSTEPARSMPKDRVPTK